MSERLRVVSGPEPFRPLERVASTRHRGSHVRLEQANLPMTGVAFVGSSATRRCARSRQSHSDANAPAPAWGDPKPRFQTDPSTRTASGWCFDRGATLSATLLLQIERESELRVARTSGPLAGAPDDLHPHQ